MIIKPPRGTLLNLNHSLNRGLVACYDFNELSGNIVNDISGFKNNANLINSPVWIANVFGGGLEFDPASQNRVDAGDSLGNFLGNGVSTIAVSLWFKANTTTSDDGIFYIGNFANTQGQFAIRIAADLLAFKMSNNTFFKTTPFNDDFDWHHLVAMYDGVDGFLYLDNSEAIKELHSTDLNLSGLNVIMGGYYGPATWTFDGQIDNVRIYNRVLSPSEIRQLSLRPDDIYLRRSSIWGGLDAAAIAYALKYTNGSTGVLANMRTTNGVSGAEIVFKRTNGSTGDVINTSGV